MSGEAYERPSVEPIGAISDDARRDGVIAALEARDAAYREVAAERDRWIACVKLLEGKLDAIRGILGGAVLKQADPVGDKPRAHEVHVEAVQRFADAMVAKLDKNASKGHWSACDTHFLLTRLHEELIELRGAVASGDADAIRDEAVDLANFSMFVFDNVGTDGKAEVQR